MNETALVPIGDIERMAKAIAASGLFGMKTPDQAMALMLVAQAEGRHPALAARDFHVINGQPALKSTAIVSRFQEAGGRVEWKERSEAKAVVVAMHPAGGNVTVAWTMEDARRAGLAEKPNWKSWPRQMLAARAVSEAVRACYPACLSGIYTEDEVRDFDGPAMRDVTPGPEAIPAPDPVMSDLRAHLELLAEDPHLPKTGRTLIAEALGRSDPSPDEMIGLVERAEAAIEKAKAKEAVA